jgi:MFS family permease
LILKAQKNILDRTEFWKYNKKDFRFWMIDMSNSYNWGKRGWLLAIYCLLGIFLSQAVENALLNISAPLLAKQYGWNQALLLSWASFSSWIVIVFILLTGAASTHFSIGKMSIICAAVNMVAILMCGFISAIWQYVVLLVIFTFMVNCWTMQLNGILVSNWFPTKKGIVMGIITIGYPIGSALSPVITNVLWQKYGMLFPYALFAGIGLVAFILGVFFVRSYPEECGCFPDNDRNMTSEKARALLEEGKIQVKNSVWTVGRVLKTPEVWLISISVGIMVLFTFGFMSQMIPRLMAGGFSINVAAPLMTAIALLSAVGSWFCGVLDQKFGTKEAIRITHILVLVACILNCLPGKAPIIISFPFMACAIGGCSNFLVSSIISYWGRYHFLAAQRVMLVIQQVVSSCGALLVAQLAAKYTYTGSYIGCGILAIIAIGLISAVKPDAIQKKTEQFEAAKEAAASK